MKNNNLKSMVCAVFMLVTLSIFVGTMLYGATGGIASSADYDQTFSYYVTAAAWNNIIAAFSGTLTTNKVDLYVINSTAQKTVNLLTQSSLDMYLS